MLVRIHYPDGVAFFSLAFTSEKEEREEEPLTIPSTTRNWNSIQSVLCAATQTRGKNRVH